MAKMTFSRILTIAALLTSAFALPTPTLLRNDHVLPANITAASITWNSCPPGVPGASSLQCASFSVPVDWNEPHGEYFDLGLVKLPGAVSNSTSQKIGILFVNPGGPGGSASQFVASLALGAIESEYLLESFDIVCGRWFPEDSQ